jgi:hypothetical protein
MTQSNARDLRETGEATLPRRDWIVLPAVGILAILLLAYATESIARWLYPTFSEGLLDCYTKDNPTGDTPVRPNSVCRERIAESKYTVEYRFNKLGHRAGTELLPKAPGSYRIVLIGSSMTMGLFVPREMTFAALLPTELSKETGRKVEVYNEAPGGKFRGGTYPTRDSVARFNEVLEAQPDLILWVITPWDAVNAGFEGAGKETSATATQPAVQEAAPPVVSGSSWDKIVAEITKGKFADRLNYRWEQTRTSIVLKHLLLKSDSQDQYVSSYLRNEDFAGFLKAAPGPKWQKELDSFDQDVTQIEDKARAAGVPFAAVLVPNRAQAAMISMGKWPKGYDPYGLDAELKKIVESDGGIYLEILADYRAIPNPEQNYYPVDGHPDANGHAMISDFLVKELTNGAVPALKIADQSQTAMERGR